jgi:aldehyde dehydrogenase (NAD+)
MILSPVGTRPFLSFSTMPDIAFDPSLVYIGGRWRAPDSGQTLALMNPSDGSELARIARGNAADIDAAVAAARAALDGPGATEGERAGPWGSLTAAERARQEIRRPGPPG